MAELEGNSSLWSTVEFGMKRRSMAAKFALPTPFLQASSYVKANFVDTLQIDEPLKHAMIETEIKFEGIPGGCCSMLLRQCLSETSGGKAEFSVSAEIKAPENSWFKGKPFTAVNTNLLDRIYPQCLDIADAHSLPSDIPRPWH